MKSTKSSSPFELEEILSAIGDEDGAQLLGSDGMAIKIKGVVSTGVYGIDKAIGRGGVPLGRLSLIRGNEGSGKTTLALNIVSECQKQGGVAIYIDVEYKLDPEYAKNIGVDTKRLIIVQPSHLERVFAIVDNVIMKVASMRKKSKETVPVVIVLDSMNAAITKAELNGEWEDIHVSPQARVYSRLLPKLIPTISRENVALIFISQERTKIGVKFGDPSSTAGGKAPPFYASLIMKVTAIGNEKSGDSRVANKVRVECVKNQIAPPFKKADCVVVYGDGFDKERSLLDAAVTSGVVAKKGAFFKYKGNTIGQGAPASASELRTDAVLAKKIKRDIEKKENE